MMYPKSDFLQYSAQESFFCKENIPFVSRKITFKTKCIFANQKK